MAFDEWTLTDEYFLGGASNASRLTHPCRLVRVVFDSCFLVYSLFVETFYLDIRVTLSTVIICKQRCRRCCLASLAPYAVGNGAAGGSPLVFA
ncbi:MAG: hypothetical protein ACJARY_002727 [Candidatus Azotimanducaceae bacterium]|jgi:hypothetical protein